MYLDHYRRCPGWGTDQYQFMPPPMPNFRPIPSWTGMDFYNAAYPGGDPFLYSNAWSILSQYPPGEYGPGLGMAAAMRHHHRVYGGLSPIEDMEGAEIGHAAAYEAYRRWIHYPQLYEPFYGNIERQRESLIGMAIAEAAQMVQYSGGDVHVMTAAAEVAAATASRVFYESMETGYNHAVPVGSIDPYHVDDFHRHYRHHHHHDRSPVIVLPGSYSAGYYPQYGYPGYYNTPCCNS